MPQNEILGREVVIVPLKGESDIGESLRGVIERRFLRGARETYLVRLSSSVEYRHPDFEVPLRFEQVLVMPDDTKLEWAFFGGGPPGLPVLVKVFGLLPAKGVREMDYAHAETFLLARGVAESPR